MDAFFIGMFCGVVLMSIIIFVIMVLSFEDHK